MVTYDEIKKIAALAKLSLEGEDMDALVADMSSIIEFADAVSKADIASSGARRSVEPSELRPDEAAPSLPPELVLKNAHECSGTFFLARGKGLTAK